MGKLKRLTFFTPTLNRTGAEITLFNLICKLDAQFKAVVFVKFKGALLDLLPPNIRRKVLYKTPVKFNLPIKSYTLTKLSETYYSKFVFFIKTLKYRNSVWYVNTIILSEVIEYAERHKIKLIVHIHEREDFFERLPPEDLRRLIEYPALIVANSSTTAKVLSDYGREKSIEICYPPINTHQIVKNKVVYTNYRKKLGIADEVFLWAMSGSMDENKNPNLFIDAALEVLKAWPNASFMWIGASENELFNECRRRVTDLGLNEKISWVENLGADYYNYFNCADGFVLTSRKESFSLVTLEALLLGLPIVANDCGGVKEILRGDIGQIINQNEPAGAMAQAMVGYMSGELTYNADKGKQRAEEYDIEIVAAKWNKVLNDYFA